MVIYVYVGILIFLLIMAMLRYRDLMSPAILMLIPWIIAYFLLKYSDFYYDATEESYKYMLLGIVLFQLGYYLCYTITSKKKPILKKEEYLKIYEQLKLNKIVMYLLILVETILLVYYELTILRGGGLSLFFEYVHKMTYALTMILVLHVFTCGLNEKRVAKKFLILQGIPLVISLSLPSNGRAGYFNSILSFVFIYLSFHKYDNKLILKRFLQIIVIFAILFVYVAMRKNHISQDARGFVLLDQCLDWIIHYFSGGLVAFQIWFPHCESSFSFGQNTFRILYAIVNRFIDSSIPISTIFYDFVKIGPRSGSIANAYTIYYTYIVDFGKMAALFIQFLYGILYARLYISKDSKKIGTIYAFGVLIYPLMMQCFGEQYVTVMSNFIQMYLWYFIFHKCGLIYLHKLKVFRISKY